MENKQDETDTATFVFMKIPAQFKFCHKSAASNRHRQPPTPKDTQPSLPPSLPLSWSPTSSGTPGYKHLRSDIQQRALTFCQETTTNPQKMKETRMKGAIKMLHFSFQFLHLLFWYRRILYHFDAALRFFFFCYIDSKKCFDCFRPQWDLMPLRWQCQDLYRKVERVGTVCVCGPTTSG